HDRARQDEALRRAAAPPHLRHRRPPPGGARRTGPFRAAHARRPARRRANAAARHESGGRAGRAASARLDSADEEVGDWPTEDAKLRATDKARTDTDLKRAALRGSKQSAFIRTTNLRFLCMARRFYAPSFGRSRSEER